jgi:hypothetical protein
VRKIHWKFDLKWLVVCSLRIEIERKRNCSFGRNFEEE